MDDLKEKIDLLRKNGYNYDWSREIYYSYETKKVFSREVLEDNDLQWLKGKIAVPVPSGWKFYFNNEPSPALRSNLTQALSQNATPQN